MEALALPRRSYPDAIAAHLQSNAMSDGTRVMTELEKQITCAINTTLCGNFKLTTPDYILARYLVECLNAFNRAVSERERWYGRPGNVSVKP